MSDHDDENLLAELRTLFERVDPVPPLVVQAAQAALAWRRIDAELAELLSDTVDDAESLAIARGPGALVRAVTFSTGELAIDVEVQEDGPGRTLRGQLTPPIAAMVEVQTADEGTAAVAEPDNLGRFTAHLPEAKPIRLRVRTEDGASARWVETSWIVI
jgi:hypothetical protein